VNDYSPDLESKLLEVAAKGPFDLLICDFLQPTLNFRRVKGVPTLLFLHNVESVITRRHFEVAGNPFTKFFWWRQWVKMDRYEREACRRFSAVVAVSDVDREILEKQMGAKKVGAIPTGVDAKYFTPGNGPIEENSLVFTGAMDWLPNEDGILFFAREILPRISVEIPDVRLTVVGRNPSARLAEELKGYPEIRAVGRVDDIRPWVSRHVLYVVPLRIGGGTRIKIYEAMAMGKAVVSTRIGAEGLPVTSGHDVILADRPEDFARAVVRLLRNGEERRRLEDAARSYVEENASWECAAETFARLCRAAAQEAAPEPW
jgi:glycosyltransferase involved in cell wall biosynthesis